MVFASGFQHAGMAFGFGLGFLNFLGTVLFIIAVVWVIRRLVMGGRHWNRDDGSPGARGWGRGWDGGWPGRRPWGDRSASNGGAPWGGASQASHEAAATADDAIATARERLAGGEIDVETFQPIEKALTEDDAAGGVERWRTADRARATLRMRLARGEITPAEFATVRAALRS